MQEKYSNLIVDFLKSHPLISINALENKLNLPFTTIQKPLSSGDRLIPTKHIFSIIRELVHYGFTIDGFSLSLDEDTDVILGSRFIENVETIEIDGGFEYVIKEDRIFFSDFHDLL